MQGSRRGDTACEDACARPWVSSGRSQGQTACPTRVSPVRVCTHLCRVAVQPWRLALVCRATAGSSAAGRDTVPDSIVSRLCERRDGKAKRKSCASATMHNAIIHRVALETSAVRLRPARYWPSENASLNSSAPRGIKTDTLRAPCRQRIRCTRLASHPVCVLDTSTAPAHPRSPAPAAGGTHIQGADYSSLAPTTTMPGLVWMSRRS